MSVALALLASAHATVRIDVFVPLCDSALIACGSAGAGDPESLTANLYWGAAYGAERFLSRAPRFRVEARRDRPYPERPYVLRELRLSRRGTAGERKIRIRVLAYSGRHIDEALREFLAAASGKSEADLVVWAGHDRLMDVPAPVVAPSSAAKPVVVLACESEQFFGPVLRSLGARPLALTRTFMAPEAYLVEALASAVARHGLDSPQMIRHALIESYARYQRISTTAASSVFVPPERPTRRGEAHPSGDR